MYKRYYIIKLLFPSYSFQITPVQTSAIRAISFNALRCREKRSQLREYHPRIKTMVARASAEDERRTAKDENRGETKVSLE